jgi:outer membrane protein OmpA-like peptidoglycan-associated protein
MKHTNSSATYNMKSSTYSSIRPLAVGLALFMLASPLFAQDPWTLGLSGGIFNYYGDASQERTFSPAFSRPAGALSIERKLGSFLCPQLQLMSGKVYGRKDYLDVEMTSFHSELAFKVGFDLAGFAYRGSRYSADPDMAQGRLEIAPNVGFVVAYFDPEVTRISTNELIQAGHINQGGNFGTGIAWGGRVAYDFTRQWRGFVGLDMRYYLTNEVDAYVGTQSTTNDWLSYIFLGVGYNFRKEQVGSGFSFGLGEEPTKDTANKRVADGLLKGQFTHNKVEKAGVKLGVYDADDQRVAEVMTDENGRFSVGGLEPDKAYTIKLEDEALASGEGKLFLLNSNNDQVAVLEQKGEAVFAYMHIPPGEVNQMATLEADTSVANMVGIVTYKQLPQEGIMLYVMDEDGAVVDSALTGADGVFEFKQLTPNAKYLVKIASDETQDAAGMHMYFVNANDDLVMRAGRGLNGDRYFTALTEEDMTELEVFEAGKLDGSDKLLYRRHSEKLTLEPGQEGYMSAIEGFELTGDEAENDESAESDVPVQEASPAYGFDFEKETIFFEHDSYAISQNEQGTKGSVIAQKMKAHPLMRIEIHGYASQPGPYFYNVVLSQNRADELKRILVEEFGIDGGRITAIGKGEDDSKSEEEARRARVIIIE